MKLNPIQEEAVSYRQGPLLVLAGAGSGKTRVITHRIARLIQTGARPDSILAVSFTNKSAEEMRDRMTKLVGKPVADKLLLSTFHSFGVHFLTKESRHPGTYERFVIFDQSDSLGLVKELLRRSGSEAFRKFDASAVQSRISLWKNAALSPEFCPDELDYDEAAKEVYALYEKALISMRAFDFDDLVIKPVQMLRKFSELQFRWQAKIQHILIDEFQDTNAVQFELIKLLAKKDGDVCVVGDDDQSIYGWRGADIRNVKAFQAHFERSKLIPLEDNYRSYAPILNVANSAIAHCKNRAYPKVLRSVRGMGELVSIVKCEDADAECQWIAEEIRALLNQGFRSQDVAILYRSNLLAKSMEQELRSSAIAYQMFGGTQLFDRKEVKDVTAYMKVLVNSHDEISLRRIINTPARGIGDGAISRIEDFAKTHTISFTDAFTRGSRIADLSSGARQGILQLNAIIDEGREALQKGQAAHEVARRLLESATMLDRHNETEKEHKRKVENINFFLRSLERYQAKQNTASLSQFLTQITLRSDNEQDTGKGVTLSTLHAAKGLEFPVVFLMGCVEGQMPHSRTLDPKISDAITTDIEEERRLFYVGVTRARDRLYLTHPKRKLVRGKALMLTPSRFLDHLPEQSVQHLEPSKPQGLALEDAAAFSRAILEQLARPASN